MFRLLFLISVFPIALGLILQWWFGSRILRTHGPRPCRCDLNRWLPAPGDTATLHRADAPAGAFGIQFRLKAMEQWHDDTPKDAASRAASRRFAAVIPPLAGIIGVLAILAGRIPPMGAIALILTGTALATVVDLLSLPTELAAITRAAKAIRDQHAFPDPDDEIAVIRCALADAWSKSLPPILRWFQR